MSAALASPHELFAAPERRGLVCAGARAAEHDAEAWRTDLERHASCVGDPRNRCIVLAPAGQGFHDRARGRVLPEPPVVPGRPS